MNHHRLLTLGPDHEPPWVRLYIHQIGEAWAAMIVGDDAPAPGPGELKRPSFFGATPEEAERQAVAYLGITYPAS